MNRLPLGERARILLPLCEGMSIRAVARLTGASKNTVAKLLVDAGRACTAYHDANVHQLKASRVQVNEIWSFIGPKQKNVAATKKASKGARDTWTWTALDADSKVIVSYLVGGRDAEHAAWFIDDLAARLANRVQLTSADHHAPLEAVESAFDCEVDHTQLVRMYGPPVGAPGRHSPAECTGSEKVRREGNPNWDHASTNYVAHQNLTMGMHMRPFTHHTNLFSKKVEHHAHAVALHIMYYNFVRIHKALGVTPAMAAGMADRLWEIADIAKLVEDAETKHGPYKKLSP